MIALQYQSELEQIYTAFFNRPADVGGLAYWNTQLTQNGGNLSAIINSFGASAEYQSLYTGESNTAVLDTIYQNLFNRAPDSGGLAYWLGQLQNGSVTMSDVALAVSNGAQNADLTAIQNKVTAANSFTNMEAATMQSSYATASNVEVQSVKTWLSAVTSDSTTAQTAQADVFSLVDSLMPAVMNDSLSAQGTLTINPTTAGHQINILDSHALSATPDAITVTNSPTTLSASNETNVQLITPTADNGTVAINPTTVPTTSVGATITEYGEGQINIISGGVGGTASVDSGWVNNGINGFVHGNSTNENTFASIAATDNTLTTIDISGNQNIFLGDAHFDNFVQTNTAMTSATPITVQSSLQLIDATNATGDVIMTAGSDFVNGNVTTTYAGLMMNVNEESNTNQQHYYNVSNDANNGVINITGGSPVDIGSFMAFGNNSIINDSSLSKDSLYMLGANDTINASTPIVIMWAQFSSPSNPTGNTETINTSSAIGLVIDGIGFGQTAGNNTFTTDGNMVVISNASALYFANGTFAGQTAPNSEIIFSNSLVNQAALGSAANVSSAQNLAQALYESLGGAMTGSTGSTTTTVAPNTAEWFQYGGNTYLVNSGMNGGSTVNADVVKIVGTVDLSHATLTGGNIHF